VREPVRIKVDEEPHALALAQELIGIAGLDVRQLADGWEVRVERIDGDRVVVRILDAVRQALAGDPSVSALVVLDGREYRMRGE
jgi:hypothetical protein